jgi:hypothetical protein
VWFLGRSRLEDLSRDGRRSIQRFAQCLLELADASIPPGWVAVQCPFDHPNEGFWHVRPQVAEWLTTAIRVRLL